MNTQHILFALLCTLSLTAAACGGDNNIQSTANTDQGGTTSGSDMSVVTPNDMASGGTDMASEGMRDMSTSEDTGVGAVDMPPAKPDMVMPMTAKTGLDARPATSTCVVRPRPPSSAEIEVERAFGNFNTPGVLWMEQTKDKSRWYSMRQNGVLETFTNPENPNPQVFLDVSNDFERSINRTELGLLGMAFHPNWPQTPYVFISYAAEVAGNKRVSRVLRYETESDGSKVKLNTRKLILEEDQPFRNHNGGQISFGPDGMLYISLGDGGSANDPRKHGQNTQTLLGAMLRIDIDNGDPYAIPKDNPFASGQGGKPEIFAWGLRNVWRFSFDRGSGKLFAGDVGQRAIEEVNIVELGGNYGWSDKEGTQCFDKDPCKNGPWIDPITEYPHRNNDKSITGGYVYRGKAIPNLVGTYIYGDFSSGRIWGAKQDPQTGKWESNLLIDTDFAIPSFAEDADGELYILNYGGGVHKIIPKNTQPQPDNFPKSLLATGCVNPNNPKQPAAGLIPYQPVAQFWSDGATKTRFFALPKGANIEVDDDGDFLFPIGTVLVKNFDLQVTPGVVRRIETRLMMRHEDGGWGGYSYSWDANQTDATLLETGQVTKFSNTASWIYPSRGDCMNCHTGAAKRSLGLEAMQLNFEAYYPTTNRMANQLDTLKHIGVLDNEEKLNGITPLVDPQGSADTAERARAWLHTNCASCHRQDNAQRVALDLRASVGFDQMKICNTDPIASKLGVDDSKLLIPGDAKKSVMYMRATRRDVHAMPPIGSLKVDSEGAALLESWINSIQNCP